MLTFTEFLTEKLYVGDTIPCSNQYYEVWKNPTAREMENLIADATKTAAKQGIDAQLAAWLVDKTLYVWDRSIAMHVQARNAIREAGGRVDWSSAPLYIYPKRGGRASIDISDFSGSRDVHITKKELMSLLRSMPSLRIFKSLYWV